MFIRQCKFEDEEGNIFGGIVIDDENNDYEFVLCGCCGSLFEIQDVKIIEIFDTWVNLSDEIIGE